MTRNIAELRQHIAAVLRSKTLLELKEALEHFSEQRWHLTEKALLSAIYTPRALKMLSSTDDKWKWLEELEEACWRTNDLHAT